MKNINRVALAALTAGAMGVVGIAGASTASANATANVANRTCPGTQSPGARTERTGGSWTEHTWLTPAGGVARIVSSTNASFFSSMPSNHRAGSMRGLTNGTRLAVASAGCAAQMLSLPIATDEATPARND